MARKSEKPQKDTVVAFKVEPQLAELLNKLPNKSAFIRKAIAAQLGVACPLCHGEGIVPRGLHDHFSSVLPEMNHRECDGCGDDLEVPMDQGELTVDERDRLKQFFFGGPLYCDTCYEEAPECDECGWHVDTKRFSEHHRQEHRDG